MQKAISTIVLIIAIFGAGMSGLVAVRNCIPAYSTWNQHRRTRENLQEAVNLTQQKIAETNRNIERFQDSSYFVERLAREHQRVTANEVIFIFE